MGVCHMFAVSRALLCFGLDASVLLANERAAMIRSGHRRAKTVPQ